MKLIYTQAAVQDLKRLRDFIANDNPNAAQKVGKKISEAILRLLDFPQMGRSVRHTLCLKSKHSIRDLVTSDYVIRYAELASEIHVLRVWHGKEDR